MKKLLLLGGIILTLQSCENVFENPQPLDSSNESRIPRELLGKYNSHRDELIIEVGVDFIITEQLEAFKDEEKVYFSEDDIGYVVIDGNKQRITNERFKNDSVFGDVTIRKEYTLNKNLILRKFKQGYIFNFQEYGDSWSPCFLYEKGDVYVASTLNSEVLEKFPKNDDGYIKQDIDIEDASYFLKRKDQFLIPWLSFSTKTKAIKKFIKD